MRQLLETIYEKVRVDRSYRPMEDLYYMSKEAMKNDVALGVEFLKLLSAECENAMRDRSLSGEQVRLIYDLHKRVCLAAAPYDFDCYLLYVEWNREPDKKFYPPRRKVLKQVVDALQELADDKLDLLAVSMPPGSGKTTLAIFYLTWLGGRIPNEPMLTGSHSNSFVRGVYDECLRIMDENGDYLWHDAFPNVKVSSTNAKDCRIDLDKRQRFETLEFTSIGTGNAGLYRAATLLYCNENIKKVYHQLFGEALKRYNDKQTRADRKIKNYYEKICNSKQEKPFHEIILQIGNKEDMSAESENGLLSIRRVKTPLCSVSVIPKALLVVCTTAGISSVFISCSLAFCISVTSWENCSSSVACRTVSCSSERKFRSAADRFSCVGSKKCSAA